MAMAEERLERDDRELVRRAVDLRSVALRLIVGA
jgi:hypothetical protein